MVAQAELLDVVDASDRVVGRADRQEVHRLGLTHRAVHVFLVDKRNRIYLQRRSWSKDQYPGTWDSSASGHVDSGESYPQAAVRELQEELGLDLALEPLLQLPASDETGREHSLLFLARARDGGPQPRPNPEEIIEGDFFAPEEIEARLLRAPQEFSPCFRLLFRSYRGSGGCLRAGR